MDWLQFLDKASFLAGVGAGAVVWCTVFFAYRKTKQKPFLLLTISVSLALTGIVLTHTLGLWHLSGSNYIVYKTLRGTVYIADVLIWAPGMLGLVKLCMGDEKIEGDPQEPDRRNRLVKEIIAARASGIVRCGFSWKNFSSLGDLAIEFDLLDNPQIYREIDRENAKALVSLILKKDLASDREIMPGERAMALAGRFLAHFTDTECRFYDNGMINEGLIGAWNPATDAKFDTGILITGPRLSGCLWVADED